MKKTIKMLGLLLVAAAMFAGCKNAPEETSSKKDGLFSTGDTTIDMASGDFQRFELANGTWSYKSVSESTNNGGSLTIKEFTFTKSGSTKTITKGSEYQEGKIPAGMTLTDEQKNAYAAQGYTINGDRYTLSKNWSASEIATEQARLDSRYLNSFNYKYTNGVTKRNADNTKFYTSYSGNNTDGKGTVIGTYKATEWLKKN